MPAILDSFISQASQYHKDSFIQKLVNAISTPLGVEGRGTGWPQNVRVSNSKIIIWPNGINSGCF